MEGYGPVWKISVRLSAMVAGCIDLPCGQEPTKCTSHTSGRDVDADTEQKLVTFVEAGDEKRKATVACKLL